MLLLGSVASSLHAQEFRATIIGTVADPSGAAVPKASITVTEINTGAVSEPTSDGAGQDNIPFLPPGEYRMEVQAEGFSSLVRDHVTLEAGGHPTLNLGLAVGQSSQTVTVSVTKSGTRQLHGTAYEFGQISNLDANSYTNNRSGIKIPVTHYNQYGGTIGGPIFLPRLFDGRDKLAFFFGYEELKDSQPHTVFNTVAPAAERTGDFSAMLPLGCPTGYKAGNSALCANGTANPFQLYNPYTGVAGSGGSVSRSPIPTNNLTGAGLAAGKTIGDISVSNRQTTPGKTALNTGVFNTISSQQFSYHLRTLPQMISTVRQDGLNNLDSSLLKDVHFTEPVLLQLRFETFNTLNHPTFAAPAVSSATSSAFGVISSTYNTSRQTQLGGRIVF